MLLSSSTSGPPERIFARLLQNQQHRLLAKRDPVYANAAAKILADCHPMQRDFVRDPGRRVAALVPRGGGKTTAARARIVRKMLITPKARYLYIAKTRAQAEDLMWAQVKDLCEKASIACKSNEVRLRLSFPHNRSTLRLVGADDKQEIEKLRGQPFHEVLIDEVSSLGAIIVSHLLYRILGPRMGDYGGSIVLCGTPGHLLTGPFYDVTRPGSALSRSWSERSDPRYAEWLGWSRHTWTLQDGAVTVPALARLWAEALLEKKANGWTDDNPVWRREYLGLWAADDTESVFRYRPHLDDGEQWNQWDPPRDPRTGFAILPAGHDWKYVYGLDVGYSDPLALVVFAYSMTDKTLYQVYEFSDTGMYPKTIAQMLIGEALDHNVPGGVIGVTGWPDGFVGDVPGQQWVDEMSHVYGITVVMADKKPAYKHAAIELFNGDLIDGRIKILKGSMLETQLMHLQWAMDGQGNLKEARTGSQKPGPGEVKDPSAGAMRNDHTDAAVYARRLAAHKFAQTPVVEVKPDRQVARIAHQQELEDRRTSRGSEESWLSDDGDYVDPMDGF